MLALSNNVRFEFIFTSLFAGAQRNFTSALEVYKSYVASTLYRELKMRGAVVSNRQLKLLPHEQVYTSQHGVWNLSSDQGNLGTLVISNVRLVWFADINEGFNISLPFLQVSNVVLRDSKFGTALVVTSSAHSGNYVLGFKIEPEERLQTVYKELLALHAVYSKNPIYGVEYKIGLCQDPHRDDALALEVEGEETEEHREDISNTLTAYLAVEGHVSDRKVVYSPELGLAIESLSDDITLQKLWEVLPNDKVPVDNK